MGAVIDMKGKLIHELRNERGLSQRKLAKTLGLKPSTLAMYELGLRTPTLETAKRIANFFGVAVEEIFFGEDARKMRANEHPTGTEGMSS